MELNSNDYNNTIVARYLNLVTMDVGIKNFAVAFSSNVDEQDYLLRKWEAFKEDNNLLELTSIVLNKVLRVSNGALIQKKKKRGFNIIDGSLLDVTRASYEYDVKNNKDLIIKKNNKEIDTISNLWIFFEKQDPNKSPIGRGYVYSYLDIWVKPANNLEYLIQKIPQEVMKSNTIFITSPDVGDSEFSRELTEDMINATKEVTQGIYAGDPILMDTTAKAEQLSYNGKFLFDGVAALLDHLSVLTAIPLSQIRGLTVGGLNTSGAALNDNTNYVKLITKVQEKGKDIWRFFIKEFLIQEGSALATSLHKVTINPPPIHHPTPLEQLEYLARVSDLRAVNINDENIEELYQGILAKTKERLM